MEISNCLNDDIFNKHYSYYKKMFNRKGKLKVYKLKLELQKNFRLDLDAKKVVVNNKLNKNYIHDIIYKKLVYLINYQI